MVTEKRRPSARGRFAGRGIVEGGADDQLVSGRSNSANGSSPFGGRLGMLAFAIIAIASMYRVTLGIRLAGLEVLLFGCYVVRVRKVPYGWRGQPPSGYITGVPAVAIGLALVGLGIFMLARPASVADWASRHSGYSG